MPRANTTSAVYNSSEYHQEALSSFYPPAVHLDTPPPMSHLEDPDALRPRPSIPGLEFKNEPMEVHCRTVFGANKKFRFELLPGGENQGKKTHRFVVKWWDEL
jgi:hypothetical protein